MKAYIALDVGGTHIKASIVSEDGQLLLPIHHYDAQSTHAKDIILENLYTLITTQLHRYTNPIELAGVGIAFPGPFDYINGICLIKGINKYDTLYGLNLGKLLYERLCDDVSFMAHTLPDFNIRFENDASLYALGESILQPSIGSKCICFCIGTGLGSAFLESNQLITTREDVPLNGWVYDTPYKDSIIDDYISARGILTIYYSLSGEYAPSVKALADLAFSGDVLALQTFETFGQFLGEAILPFLKSFTPDCIVLGGQIIKSFALFKTSLYATLASSYKDLNILLSDDSSLSTLIGVSKLF